jgi:hypothetical protein
MNPLELAHFHLHTIVELAETGQVSWTAEVPPNANAMRAFSAATPQYQILVCQVNLMEPHEDTPHIEHEGMAILIAGGPMVIRMPPEIADRLYHQAAASRN